MKTIKIVVCDDHELFLNGLRSLLTEETWLEITGIARNGRELISLLNKIQADMVLLDLNMPLMNGFDTLIQLKRQFAAIKIVIISTYSEPHLIDKARSSGANGYLLKNSNRDELFSVIRETQNGKSCFPQAKLSADNDFTRSDPFLRKFNLTRRELEIMGLIKTSLTNQQIAVELHLSLYTVETHRKNFMKKLDLNSPASLMKFILEYHI